jgi:hypothetical protein
MSSLKYWRIFLPFCQTKCLPLISLQFLPIQSKLSLLDGTFYQIKKMLQYTMHKTKKVNMWTCYRKSKLGPGKFVISQVKGKPKDFNVEIF